MAEIISSCSSCCAPFSPEESRITEITIISAKHHDDLLGEIEIHPDQGVKVSIQSVLRELFVFQVGSYFDPQLCHDCADSLQKLHLSFTQFVGLLNDTGKLFSALGPRVKLDVSQGKEATTLNYDGASILDVLIKEEADSGGEDDPFVCGNDGDSDTGMDNDDIESISDDEDTDDEDLSDQRDYKLRPRRSKSRERESTNLVTFDSEEDFDCEDEQSSDWEEVQSISELSDGEGEGGGDGDGDNPNAPSNSSPKVKKEDPVPDPTAGTVEGTMVCPFPSCLRTYTKRKSYRRHYISAHLRGTRRRSKVKIHTCKKCDLTFSHKDLFRIHKESHKPNSTSMKLHKCPICSQPFAKLLLHDHVISHGVENPYSCLETDCPEKFPTLSLLQKHRTNAHYKLRLRTKCTVCSSTFRSSWHMRRHQERIHMVRSDTTDAQFCCDTCSKVYPTEKQLKEHVRSHSSQEKCSCPFCGKIFAYKRSMRRHLTLHTTAGQKLYCCWENECGQIFASKENLVQHHLDRHPSSQVKLNLADLCKMEEEIGIEDDIKGLREAIFRKNMAKPEVNKVRTKRDPNQPCPTCGKIVVNLATHLATHISPRIRHLCELCGQDFSSRSGLLGHVQFRHKPVTPLLCSNCGKSFKRNRDLRAHMKLHELGDAKPFTCQICGKQVRTEKSLRQHVDLVHTKIGKQFKCEQCGHEFKQNHNLRQHIKMVHQGEKRRPREPGSEIRHKRKKTSPASSSTDYRYHGHDSRLDVSPVNPQFSHPATYPLYYGSSGLY